jgi:prepilin-type N-terminal cleavage/methylation domain-containing protein
LKSRLFLNELMIKSIPDENGFTLLELIAVLVILSVLAAIAIPRYISIDEKARQRAIDAGIAELNGRETLTWSNIKITMTGYIDDAALFPRLDTTLGKDYSWVGGPPDKDGGILKFKESLQVPLVRSESTDIQPGFWTR